MASELQFATASRIELELQIATLTELQFATDQKVTKTVKK